MPYADEKVLESKMRIEDHYFKVDKKILMKLAEMTYKQYMYDLENNNSNNKIKALERG